MRRHAKAPSAGSTQATGSSRGLLRRAAAMPAFTQASTGVVRPHAKLFALLAISLIALFATSASASAAPPAATPPEVSSVSYATADVTGKVTSPGCGGFCQVTYSFEYSTDQVNWTAGSGGEVGRAPVENKEIPVTTLAGLKGGTTYFVRLKVSSVGSEGTFEAVSPEPNPDFTTLAVDPPTIPGVAAASPIFSTSATATAKVKRPANADPAFDVNCHFEYITDDQYKANELASEPLFAGAAPPVPCTENPVTAAKVDAGGELEVKAPLTGLSPATDYHLRLVAENAAPGVVIKDGGNFTTATKVAAPTVIATDDASEVKFNSAKFTGKVLRPDGDDPALNVNCRFEYITDAQFQENLTNIGPEAGFEGATPADCEQNTITAAKVDVDGEIEVSAKPGLLPVSTYHFRLVAENEGGSDSEDAANTFTTPEAEKPVVTIDPVEGGTFTTAHVSGTIEIDDPGYNGAPVRFEISTDNVNWSGGREFNTEYPPGVAINIEADFTGLQPSTTYFFRIASKYLTNSWVEGEANGELAYSPEPNPSITTEPPSAPATGEDLAITDVTATTAHFSGTVNPNAPAGPLSPLAKKAYETKWHFECAPECKDANGNVIGGTIQGEEGPQPVTGDVKRLDTNTEYEVWLVVSSEGGGMRAVDTFNTPLIKPTVKALDGASDGKGGYTLAGTVNPNGSPVSDCKFEWGPNSADYAFSVPCSPTPVGRNEVQAVDINATTGQFRLSYRGQTTPDIAVGATAAVVESELEALSLIGPNLTVTGGPDPAHPYVITFEGGLAEKNLSQIQAQGFGLGGQGSQTGLGFSTKVEGSASFFTTVEAHLTGLNPGVIYHYNLLATNGAGTAESGDQEFIPTLDPAESCPNEQLRTESSSLALPECRAYEMVTPPGKEGFGAAFGMGTNSGAYDGDGDRVGYFSGATNIAKSGQGSNRNAYVAARTAAGWETIPNLNGSSGSFRDAPSYVDSNVSKTDLLAYSPDLRSSAWQLHRQGDPDGGQAHLRGPDGTLALIGTIEAQNPNQIGMVELSDDLSHLVTWARGNNGSSWGPGVYEFLGTGMDQPRRVDLDNSGSPVSSCLAPIGAPLGYPQIVTNVGLSVSSDGGTILFKAQGALNAAGSCEAGDPPADEIWARINGTTAVDVSASHCDRVAPAPACNAPANAAFLAATPDASRVFFATTQQLVNADTDETNDIYACDIPTGNPAPTADKANHCTALVQVSGAQTGAKVEFVEDGFGRRSVSGATSSEDGSAVSFVAQGVLADNEDALGEKALAGDHNLYVWRADASHPDGQTTFVGRLDSNDVGSAQITPDGRYAVFTTTTQLVDTDTDSARDVYRYDADSGTLTRVSTNVFGVAGNAEGFDARIGAALEHNPSTAISDDGTKIVFTTTEPLDLAVDGNDEPDIYLWTPSRVSLISTGAVGAGGNGAFITASGRDIYFQTFGALTPADGDDAGDIYDARIGGGFSFAQAAPCSGAGGTCQSHAPATATAPTPATAQPPADPGNVKPKTCPKGKVLNKKGKCVKKKPKKHSGKKHHGKKAGHKQRGGK